MTLEQLKEVLDKHAKWLRGEEGGQRADMRGWAQVAFSGHGERGRMLTAIIQTAGAEAMYQCWCFYGTEQELRKYIEDGHEHHRQSRLLALDSVNAMLKMSIERKG